MLFPYVCVCVRYSSVTGAFSDPHLCFSDDRAFKTTQLPCICARMCVCMCVRLTARKGSSTRVWYSRNPCLVSFALGRHCQSALVPIKMKNKPAVETFCRPCGLKVEAYLTVGGLCSASCLTGLEAGSGFLTNVMRIVFFLR